MQKFIVRVVVALVVLFGMGSYIYKTNKIIESYERQEIKISNKELLSMMLETSAGSGEYQETTASAWPTEGYVFNENLSKCEKGSSLSWDSTKKTVVMVGNNADRCYVYFDMNVPSISDLCDGKILSDCIKAQYTGKQGVNNLYFHNGTIKDDDDTVLDANDNSYRYAGASETTNNFVCFGYDSTDGTCPSDNLYRIIGVFGDEVKLIKYDYAKSTLLGTDGDYYNIYSKTPEGLYTSGNLSTTLYKGNNLPSEIGTYHWNNLNGMDQGTNNWSTSRLNTVNLNTNYINNIVTKWSNKISTHTWKVGGNTQTDILYVIPSIAYQNEITNPAESTTYDAKIGLIYVSDYGYAASPSAWSTVLISYNYAPITSVNWMYMGLEEWTISRDADDTLFAYYIADGGHLYSAYTTVGTYVGVNAYAIRPVFYLNSNVMYVSGSGTMNSPILLS